jgi:hypothetical protein
LKLKFAGSFTIPERLLTNGVIAISFMILFVDLRFMV